jgi:hypothetical protein
VGYFKNQLIAEQVELGDRIPSPMRAIHHVGYPTRKTVRQGRQIAEAEVKKKRATHTYVVIGWLLIGASIGFAAGVMAVFA